jgi:ActR/RegA family two-component response regulator
MCLVKKLFINNVIRRRKMKFLIVDDNSNWIETLARTFQQRSNVRAVQCLSVQDVIGEINNFKPDIVFLDHRLSPGGNEGFEVVGAVTGVKFYSTTTSREVIEEYRDLDIEVIGSDLDKMEAIINASAS